jgi:hypothetical protein
MPVAGKPFRVLPLLAVLTLTLVALALPARSDAALISNERADFSFTLANPCTGELVTLEGTTHFLFSTTVDQGGGEHFVSESNTSGTGTGASGATYAFSTRGMFIETPDNGPVFGFTTQSTFRVTRLGGGSTADDFIVTTLFKGMVVNDEVVVDIEKFEFECA